MNTLDRLIEMADKVNIEEPSPWQNKKVGQYSTVTNADGLGVAIDLIPSTAQFISAANPDTVKRLCELVKEAKKLIPYVSASENVSVTVINESLTWIKKLEQLEKENTNESE